MSEYGLTDGTVYLASDGNWYRWPDPTPHDSEESARGAEVEPPIPATEVPSAAVMTPAASYGVEQTFAPAASWGPPQTVAPGAQYGATGNNPPAYGAPGYLQPKPGRNGFAVAALALSIVGGILLSVIFGFIALSQTKKTGQAGRRLAIAALVISAFWAVGIVAAIAISIAPEAERGDQGDIVAAGDVSAFELKVGDCINGLVETNDAKEVPGVPCAQPHEGEVFAIFELPDGAFPGAEKVFADAERGCSERFAAYAGPAAEADRALELFYLTPSDNSWPRGDRIVACVATKPNVKQTGSIRG